MESFNGIKNWAIEDRPREKFAHKGRQALTDTELLAILIGTGTKNITAVDLARNLLAAANNSLDKLGHFSLSDLKKFKGIGEAKAINIAAALELGRRRKEANSEKVESPITSSKDVYMRFSNLFLELKTENFAIALLNRANKVMQHFVISTGGVSGTVADPRVILKPCIELQASGLILMHNHPSGNLKPSQADIDLTNKIKGATQFIDIKLFDHLIFTDTGYFSFADEGLL